MCFIIARDKLLQVRQFESTIKIHWGKYCLFEAWFSINNMQHFIKILLFSSIFTTAGVTAILSTINKEYRKFLDIFKQPHCKEPQTFSQNLRMSRLKQPENDLIKCLQIISNWMRYWQIYNVWTPSDVKSFNSLQCKLTRLWWHDLNTVCILNNSIFKLFLQAIIALFMGQLRFILILNRNIRPIQKCQPEWDWEPDPTSHLCLISTITPAYTIDTEISSQRESLH